MARSRNTYTPRIDAGRGIGNWNGSSKIFDAVERGLLSVQTVVLTQGQRIDHLAGQYYGSSSYWWVIASASGIGWVLQCPPGTVIRIPENLELALEIGV